MKKRMPVLLPQEAVYILDTLNRAGHEAYAVGGCIRDSLLGQTPQDWDIAASANPYQIMKLFPYTVETGIAHGTVTVLINRRPFEVTTFRIDGEYLDGRRPSYVSFTSEIVADLARRDFTMNAIAFHPHCGLKDPFNGKADIQNKIIRCVGNPERRFGEDALRMMRAVRFAAQLGFTIDSDTKNAIPPLADKLVNVSVERIREELTKTLCAAHPSALALLEQLGLWRQIIHSLPNPRIYLNETIPLAEICPENPAMRYALLLRRMKPEEACGFMRHLRFDNKTVRETALYVKGLSLFIENSRYSVKKMLLEYPPALFENLLILKRITASSEAERASTEDISNTFNEIIADKDCFSLKELAVSGAVLREAGIPEGEAMGRILAALLDIVMRDPSQNTASNLINHALNMSFNSSANT